MKRFLSVLVVLFVSIQFVCASDNKDYSILFNKTRFHLLYSVKNPDFGGYLNEYYKKGETYNIWSEMVAIHHFPNAYSPIDRIKDFKDYLSSMNVPSSLTFDDKRNSALIDFIIITNNQMPVVLEFNVFKYEKSKKCGSIALQYVKRYSATTTMQIEDIKKDFEKHRKCIIKKVKKHKIPPIIPADIDKCISGIEVNNQKDAESPALAIETSSDEEKSINVHEKDSISAEKSNVKEGSEITSEEICENKVLTEEIAVDSDNNSMKPCETEEKDAGCVTEQNIDIDESKAVTASCNEKDDIVADENKKDVVAPVPQEVDVTKENNNIKNLNYVLSNNKEEFIAQPRTKKELKAYKKEQKAKLKQKNKSYTVTNNKDGYISSGRTNKDFREYRKNRKQAKKRAKMAKQKLSE